MSLLDTIQQQLGPQQVQQISQQVGADPATTEQAVHAALPMMLGGMATGAREPGGASALAGMLGGGGLGGMLGGLLGGGGGGGGMDLGGVLGSVLGRSQPAVQDGVQQASGLNGDQTKKLLMILAPIVLGAIMKSRQQRTADGVASAGGMAGGFGIPGMGGAGGTAPRADASQVDSDGDGIPDYLEREARSAQEQSARRSPQIGGIVGKILDMAQRPPR